MKYARILYILYARVCMYNVCINMNAKFLFALPFRDGIHHARECKMTLLDGGYK